MKKYEVWKSCELGYDYQEKIFETKEEAEKFVARMEKIREGWHWRVVPIETPARTNAGYTITQSITINVDTPAYKEITEIVVGERTSSIAPYVTWQCVNGNNYFWGHYFEKKSDAVRDMYERAHSAMQCL